MEIHHLTLTLHGRKRKEAADCVGDAIGVKPIFFRAGQAHDLDGIVIDRHGVLKIGDHDKRLPKILDALQAAGFYTPEEAEAPLEEAEASPNPVEEPPPEAPAEPVEAPPPEPEPEPDEVDPLPEKAEPLPEEADPPPDEAETSPDEAETPPEEAEAPPEEEEPEPETPEPVEEPPSEEAEPLPEPGQGERLVIQMPLEGFPPEKIDNLCKLVASKETLIKKAIGVESLPIAFSPTTIDFPWVPEGAQSNEVMAYAQLVSKLCDMAKTQQRVLAVEHPVQTLYCSYSVIARTKNAKTYADGKPKV